VETGGPRDLHPGADDNARVCPYAASMASTATHSSVGDRGDRLLAMRLRPLAVATVAVVVVLSAREHPAPALSGGGLAVTIALLVLVASIVLLVRDPDGRFSSVAAPVGLIVSSAGLLWTQHAGPGMAGLFVGVSYAALRLPPRLSLGLLGLAAVGLAAGGAHSARSTGLIVGAELGIVAFYVLAVFARRVREAHEETARLLSELEASRRSREEAAALRERGRIAREMHDVLAHSLSGLMLQLEGARMLAGTPDANGRLPEALDRAHRLARGGLEEARRAIGALRDDDLPGPERLAQLTAEHARDSGIVATLEVSGTPHPLDSETALTLFRVAQEALTNSRNHANPQRVELRLAYEPDGTRLVVQDHGEPAAASASRSRPDRRESSPDGARAGYGLTGMRERAELLGGRLEAAPTADGFRVELWVPA
jgi:signal transduction histidine kinase